MTLSLKRINNILAILLMLLGLYIVVSPFAPLLTFRVKEITNKSKVNGQTAKLNKPVAPEDIPADNRIRIPKLLLDEQIIQSPSIGSISKGGTWLRPYTVRPGEAGNSVIVGHRFIYQGPATFYNLDKVEVGDKIAIFWDKKRYVYDVYDIFETQPSNQEVEAPMNGKILTLYTCTPLWSAHNRLIVRARLVES